MSKTSPNLVVQEIARHQSRLRAFVRCLMVRPSDVDDLLQEINVVLWEKADEFQPNTDFWAWALGLGQPDCEVQGAESGSEVWSRKAGVR